MANKAWRREATNPEDGLTIISLLPLIVVPRAAATATVALGGYRRYVLCTLVGLPRLICSSLNLYQLTIVM